MAAELVQVRMTKSVDFASRGELVWMEPAMAQAIVGMSLAVVVREKAAEEVADGDGGEGDDQPAAGDSRSRKGKRPAGPEAG
jgi:hypothetical protein